MRGRGERFLPRMHEWGRIGTASLFWKVFRNGEFLGIMIFEILIKTGFLGGGTVIAGGGSRIKGWIVFGPHLE